MNLIMLDTNNEEMMNKLMPLYFNYEAELTNLKIEEIFNIEKPLENKAYFEAYFKRGIHTMILENDKEYIGFVSYHVDSDEVPGYAKNYRGFGHLAEIYLVDEYKHKGLSRLLVNTFEEEMSKQNIKKFYLVDISKKHEMWIKFNYNFTGEIEPEEQGLIYKKILST